MHFLSLFKKYIILKIYQWTFYNENSIQNRQVIELYVTISLVFSFLAIAYNEYNIAGIAYNLYFIYSKNHIINILK